MSVPVTDPRPWTTPTDAVSVLRRRWDSGSVLAALAREEPFTPVDMPLRGPTARELASRLGEAQQWATDWDRFARRTRPQPLRVEMVSVGGRLVGNNRVPARLWVDTVEQLVAVLGVEVDLRAFRDVVTRTRAAAADLLSYVAARPRQVLALAADWPRLLDTVHWVDNQAQPGMYVRHIDAPGVDTKFIERHNAVLCDLLDIRLAPDRIDAGTPRSDFAARYGFLRKPTYLRVRATCLPGGLTEMWARADEAASVLGDVRTVFIIENEVTYLAFPLAPDAAVVWGGGYTLGGRRVLAWLSDRDVRYWGDVDTHGLAILGRLRQQLPAARSFLMDAQTLTAHRAHWGREPAQVTSPIAGLTAAEAALHRDLVEGTYGDAVRLEQERVRFSAVRHALDCF